MNIKFPKASSVWPFELGVRRLHTKDLLQTYKDHVIFHVRCIWNYVCEVTQCTFQRILGSFLSKLLNKLRAFHLKSLNSHAKRITYVRVILYLCILRFCGLFCKNSTWHSFKQFFQVTTILS